MPLGDYSVVVLGWKRREGLVECVRRVQGQVPAPREVIVWHNGGNLPVIDGTITIRSSVNYRCSARHAVGLLAEAEIVVFVDDDVWLRDPCVCQALVEGVEMHPGAVIGTQGKRLDLEGGQLYAGGPDVIGNEADVDVVKGMLHAVRREYLVCPWRFDLPRDVRDEDDIVLSATVSMRTGCSPRVIAIEKTAVEYRRDDQLGLQHGPDHFARRDAACAYMMSLGWLPRGS